MDEAAIRTAFMGLFGGFVIYGLSLAALYVLPQPLALYASTTLLVVALVFGVAWVVAVRRGWRVGPSEPRSAKRRKDRGKRVNPWTRR